eukprot:4704096-Prymnesium_polylepis.2
MCRTAQQFAPPPADGVSDTLGVSQAPPGETRKPGERASCILVSQQPSQSAYGLSAQLAPPC